MACPCGLTTALRFPIPTYPCHCSRLSTQDPDGRVDQSPQAVMDAHPGARESLRDPHGTPQSADDAELGRGALHGDLPVGLTHSGSGRLSRATGTAERTGTRPGDGRATRTPNDQVTPRMSRALLRVGSMPLFGGCLQPATHRSLVGQVVRREAGLQVLLLSRDDHERHQRHRWNEGDE